MMKKIIFAVILLALTLAPVGSEAQSLATAIRVQAMQMGNAAIRNDFNTFIKYMHPDIVAFAGGKVDMKTKMDSAYQMMKQFGVTFKRYWIGSPGEIVKYKDQLQALLPQSTSLKTPFGEVNAETTMLVISKDGGKNWWFIDTNVYSADKLKNIMPDLSPKLVIPPRTKPKLVPANKVQ